MSATLNKVKKHLRPGQVYRRADIAQWTNAVDRHLRQLVDDGTLTKLSRGLYYFPKKTAFGNVPVDDEKLVAAFLRDDHFLLSSPNAYNALGVGTTQLYNETVVYNRKRSGRFKLGGRSFDFRVKPAFPESLSKEFLLVDLVNNLHRLAEDTDMLLKRVREKAFSMNADVLGRMVGEYGNARARKFFREILSQPALTHAA